MRWPDRCPWTVTSQAAQHWSFGSRPVWQTPPNSQGKANLHHSQRACWKRVQWIGAVVPERASQLRSVIRSYPYPGVAACAIASKSRPDFLGRVAGRRAALHHRRGQRSCTVLFQHVLGKRLLELTCSSWSCACAQRTTDWAMWVVYSNLQHRHP